MLKSGVYWRSGFLKTKGRLDFRYFVFGCVFLVLLGFYWSYSMTPLVHSYDTFFDLDQEIQIKRWVLPWDLFSTELSYHAEFVFRHPGGYYPRLILQPLASLVGPDWAVAVFLAALGSANLYLAWEISGRLQPDSTPRVALFLLTISAGSFLYANLTLDTFTLSLPLQLAIVNQYLKDPDRGSWRLLLLTATSTMITVTNIGLYLVLWIVRLARQGRNILSTENLKELLLLCVVCVGMVVAHYLIWLLPLNVDLLDGARRTYWVLADNIKSDFFRYLLTFIVYSGVPPAYELIEVSLDLFIYDFRSPAYSFWGGSAAILWLLMLFLGVVFSLLRRDPHGIVGVLGLLYFILLHYGFHSRGSVFLFVLQLPPVFMLIFSCAIREFSSRSWGMMAVFYAVFAVMVVNGEGVYFHVTGQRLADLTPSIHRLSKSLCDRPAPEWNPLGVFQEFELRNCLAR